MKFIPTLLLAAWLLPAQDGAVFKTIDYPQATMTQAWGINSRGEIVGYYAAADASLHGFRFSADRYSPIDYPGATTTQAFGINVQGDAVGICVIAGVTHGFLLRGNRYASIDFPGAERSEAAGINARGDIVGVYVKGGVNHGFLLRGSEFTSIDYPGASSTGGNGLNDRGDVVGNYLLGGATHGFMLRGERYTSIDVKDATLTGAFGINTAGEITGRYRDAANVSHGYVLRGDSFEAFDHPQGTFTGGTAINAAGDVVGRYVAGGITHGLLLASARQQRYTVTDLGTLGGNAAGALGNNNAGAAAGSASLPGGNFHPFLSRNDRMTDLGTLGGPNGAATNPNGGNQVSVVAETVMTDPLNEDFCGWGTRHTCLAAIWQDGKLTQLPTLGGNNAIAFGLNERGQIAGTAEKSAHDPACAAPQTLTYAPAIWGPGSRVQELRMPAGDTVGFAIAINDKGEAVGGTGNCDNTTVSAVSLNFSQHAILWQNSTAAPIDLGTLDGPSIAVAINNRSEVVGGSMLSDESGIRGFLWSRDAGLRAIHPVDSDSSSLPAMINNNRQIVGASCDAEFNCRAFLWARNTTLDLNELIPADSTLHLAFAAWINDAGEIVGQAIDKSTGEMRAFLARPVRSGNSAPDAARIRTGAGISPLVRSMLQHQRLQGGQLKFPLNRRHQ